MEYTIEVLVDGKVEYSHDDSEISIDKRKSLSILWMTSGKVTLRT